jgi:hypothetical protein
MLWCTVNKTTCIIVLSVTGRSADTCLPAANHSSRDRNHNHNHKTDTYCQSVTVGIWRSSSSCNTKTAVLICHRWMDFGMQSSHRSAVERTGHSYSKRVMVWGICILPLVPEPVTNKRGQLSWWLVLYEAWGLVDLSAVRRFIRGGVRVGWSVSSSPFLCTSNNFMSLCFVFLKLDRMSRCKGRSAAVCWHR